MPLSTERVEPRLSVAIPGSIVSDTPHLREKTAKLGVIARACAIFGVREIILYSDNLKPDQLGDMQLCSQILGFIETPPYLRKKLFPLNPSLKFTGILPPLQAPHHNVPISLRESKNGDLRDGVVVARHGGTLVVDVGLERTLECPGENPVGGRLTVRLTDIARNLTGEIVDASKISISGADMRPIYWGYRVHKAASLGRVLNDRRWDLKVGTSRYGVPIHEVLAQFSRAVKTSRSALIAFGSPKMGLGEILAKEKLHPKDVFHYFVNTAPDQQTATVRTEEAIMVSLAILNLTAKLVGM